MKYEFDVGIVGGGPVGLAAAIFLAQKKKSVIVLEKRKYPIDKACGEGIMPHGVAVLQRLGISQDWLEQNGHPFQGIRYLFPQQKPIEGSFNKQLGYGVKRALLSSALFEVAKSFPSIQILEDTPVLSVEPIEEGVNLQTPEKIYKVEQALGADGLRSFVRKKTGFQTRKRVLWRYGCSIHYPVSPWSNWVEVHWSHGCEAYVTPLGQRETGVALLWNKQKVEEKHPVEMLNRFPLLMENLKGFSPSRIPLSTGPFFQSVFPIVKGRVALIGDAAGYIDALTGEGLSLGFLQAQFFAEKGLKKYEKAYSSLTRSYRLITYGLLKLSQNSLGSQILMGYLSKQPWALEKVLNFLVK